MAGLSDDLKLALCPRPYEVRFYRTEVKLVDGTEELVRGTSPPPLCDGCPYRDSQRRPINHIKIVRRPPAKEEAAPRQSQRSMVGLRRRHPSPSPSRSTGR